jgi:hypothetical protein
MSGQPYKYATDIDNFRADYMKSLELRANLDDMNLQANKTYKDTGALPPQSTMKDTRTTPEILADVGKLKLSLINELKAVASTQMAQLVVQRIEQSPLNADGSFLIWFSQNVPELVSNLRKKYKFGIAGNDNDAEQMFLFLQSIYARSKDLSQSVKSAFDRPSTDLYGGINAQDLSGLGKVYDEIQFRLVSKLIGAGSPRAPEIRKLITDIKIQFDTLMNVMSTRKYEQVKEIFLQSSSGHHALMQQGINLLGYSDFINFVEKLPSPSILRTLLDQLQKSERNQTPDLSIQILENLSSVLPTSQKSSDMAGLIENIIATDGAASIVSPLLTTNPLLSNPNIQDVLTNPVIPNIDQPNNNLLYSTAGAIATPTQTVIMLNELCSPIAREINDYLRGEGRGASQQEYEQKVKFIISEVEQQVGGRLKGISYDRQILLDAIENVTGGFDSNSRRAVTSLRLKDEIRRIRPNEDVMIGASIKRRGRPKGSGLVKPISERIDHTKGIKQGHTHVPFGKYILNKNKLDSDLVYFKHAKGYGVKGFPMSKVSNRLGSVLRTIIGGGVPKFEELQGLSNEEKEYLHKVANKVGIMDKISIPTPSKDKLEQDIHQFEVMKGEIMSGNDSPELIKKFKLILLRLSKNGTIPKRESVELLEDLIHLGF